MKFHVEVFRHEEFADLIREYEAWRKAHGIKKRIGPYELVKEMKGAERKWLRGYIKRWEARI